jgi:hypothetical protein
MGCGCATMSRNDPPHLVAMLDLLRQGHPARRSTACSRATWSHEITGVRERLTPAERVLVCDAKRALERMIARVGLSPTAGARAHEVADHVRVSSLSPRRRAGSIVYTSSA